MKKIEHLRDILKKQDSLLVEFQRRQEYDTKQYHLVQPDEAIKHFLLVRNRDNEKVYELAWRVYEKNFRFHGWIIS